MKKLLYLSFVFAVMTAFGFAQDGTTDIDKQIAEYSEAVKNNPNDVEAYIDRAWAYYTKEDYDRAIADCSEVLRLKPNNGEAYLLRCDAYEQKGDYDKAIAGYSELIRTAPDENWRYIRRGKAYFKKGDYTKAIADYSEVIKRDSDNFDAHWLRAYAYYHAKNYDAAIADCTRVIKSWYLDDAPDSPTNVYMVRGDAYGAKGVYHKAAADYRTSLEKGYDPSGFTVDRSSKADMWFCGALYMEIVVNRFLGKSDAVSKYETWLQTVCDTNKLSRADVEAYFRQNIGALVAAAVDEEFNRISFLIDRTKTVGSSYGAVLARNTNNQYILNYEGYFNGILSTKTLPPANSLDALSSVMSGSGDFIQDDIRQVRSQAALIPAVTLDSGALDDIKRFVTAFCTSPNAGTYNAVKDVYFVYENRSHNELFNRIWFSYSDTLRSLAAPLMHKIYEELNSPTTLTREQQQRLIGLRQQ
jgi:tetratricopeptide (TPR) repeat protein